MRITYSNEMRGRRWPIALLLLTLFALAMRCYYVSTALVLDPVRGDAAQYVTYASNLIEHHIFGRHVFGSTTITPDNYRDPGYPFLLALLMKAFGTGDAWYAAVLLTQALLGSLTVALVTQTGRSWLSPKWALAAGLVMAAWPHSLAINGYLLTETLFSFLCAAAILLLTQAFHQNNRLRAFMAGTVMGAAALTNAILLPAGVFIACVLGWRKVFARSLWIVLAAGSILLPGVWAIRNVQLPPGPASSSSLGRALENFSQGASPEFHGAYRDSFFGDAEAKAKASITMLAVGKQYSMLTSSPTEGIEALLHVIGKQPAHYAAWYFVEKPVELWSWSIVVGQGDIYVYPTTNSPFQNNRGWIVLEVACQALNFLILLLAVASVIAVASPKIFDQAFLGGKRSQTSLSTTFLLFAFVTLIYSVLQSEPRYSIPFRPFEILLAFTTAAGLSTFIRQQRSRVKYGSTASGPHHLQAID